MESEQMKIVIDSNIVISALISSNGITRYLIMSDSVELIAPEFLLGEIEKHKAEAIAKSKVSGGEFEIALSIISSRITFSPKEEFGLFLKKAESICPDPKDTEFFALALSKDAPLWSRDKALKKQNEVKIISTKEIADSLGKK